MIKIKIYDPAGNRMLVAGLEGRDFSNHATATGPLCKVGAYSIKISLVSYSILILSSSLIFKLFMYYFRQSKTTPELRPWLFRE